MNDPLRLNTFGQSIVDRGGHDDVSDDDYLILEIVHRCPGMPKEDIQQVFIALRMEYGEDALYAIRNGHVILARDR